MARIERMKRSRGAWSLGTALGAALLVSGAARTAHADEPLAPLPAEEAPPSPPVQVQPVVRPPPGAPTYASYQRRRHHYEPESRWYGWQTLVTDGATFTITGAMAKPAPGLAAGIFLAGYGLGGPIVHLAHGNVGRAFIDLAIRVGAPIVLGVTGYVAFSSHANDPYDDNQALGAAIGVVMGGVAAIAIDAAVIAREPVHDEDEDDAFERSRRVRPRTAFSPGSWSPMIAPRAEGGAVLGLSGTM